MTINQDDVLEVSARMEFNDVEDVVNVYQFQKVDAGSISDQNGVDDMLTIMEDVYTLILTLISLVTTFRDIRIFNKTQSVLLGVHDWPTLTVGGGAGDPTAPGVAGVLNFSTIVPKVSLRKYYGVFKETALTGDGTLGPGGVAQIADIGTLLLVPRGEIFGIWEYGYLSPKTLGWIAPNGASNDDIPGYQRRRKHGRGS